VRGSAGVTRVLQHGNQISDAGAAGLGEGLKVNSSLYHLWLVRPFDYCLFFVGAMRGEGGEGSAGVTRVLQRENQISDAGAAGLGEGLKVNSSLQRLHLVRLFDY
jgi:methyl coenzyme M reductase subunit D